MGLWYEALRRQMFSHHKQERGNDMKKRLIIALACLVLLAACGTTQVQVPNHPTSGGTQTPPKQGTISAFSIPTAVSNPWNIALSLTHFKSAEKSAIQ